MSMIMKLIAAAVGDSNPYVVFFSGHTESITSGVGPWKNHIIFNTDGTIDKRTQSSAVNDTTVQINTVADWIRPVSAAGDGTGFEVRFVDAPGNGWDEEAATINTWVDFSEARIWGYTSALESDDDSGPVTFEIRIKDGATLASDEVDLIIDSGS